MDVGIRELRNRLSEYVARGKAGDAITSRTVHAPSREDRITR